MQLPATLTLTQATATVERVRAALSQAPSGSPLVVDASALSEFDTSAIAVLLEAHRLAQAGGVAFEVCGSPAKLRQLAALYGVDALLGLQDAA